ncbi:hypothetical protein FQR65_LT16180 [Abscondita terminalis]|nr:hypothetical protein FQR65_LT16180 [Abscondita terminalis]
MGEGVGVKEKRGAKVEEGEVGAQEEEEEVEVGVDRKCERGELCSVSEGGRAKELGPKYEKFRPLTLGRYISAIYDKSKNRASLRNATRFRLLNGVPTKDVSFTETAYEVHKISSKSSKFRQKFQSKS